MSLFRSEQEFREVMDRAFALMSDDPDMGPKLRDADTPQRFEFTDLELVVNIRAGAPEEPNLVWEWSDDVGWEPKVRMTMSSETANRYFQGKENVAIAIARRRIKAGGDVKAALHILPITKPLFGRYREMVAADYPHPVILEGVSPATLAEAVTVLRRHERFSVETHALTAPGALARLRDTVGIGRVLFGADSPGQSLGAALRSVQNADLSDADKAAVLSGNAQRLWQNEEK